MEIIPAIDLRGGQVVRQRQGDYERETLYDVAPQALAGSYISAGARWLHVIDVDGALTGTQENLPIIAELAGLEIQLQAGGGVRDEYDLKRLFDMGVQRVVVGSLAMREPATLESWLLRYGGERLCIALDVRQQDERWQLVSRGRTSGEDDEGLETLASFYARVGAAHMLCTDIESDGMLEGPNLDLYRKLVGLAPEIALQASGGVRNSEDIQALRELRVAAVVLGRSLLEGRLSVEQALAAL